MASEQAEATTVSLKLFVDRAKQRVVFVETDKHLVDILISFLTLPMGTIVRVLGKQLLPRPAKIGCMNNLFESVENLSTEAMVTDICKLMLHRPRNLFEDHLKNLKVNLDDSVPNKFFICSKIECRGDLFSYYINARCRCGNLMDREVALKDSDNNGEVFISGAHKFIITDDLQVMHFSPATCIRLLSSLGIRDVKKQLVESNLNIDLKGIANLLKRSFVSNSPLTDVFLPKLGSSSNKVIRGHQNHFISPDVGERGSTMEPITIKVLTSKSDNRAIFAEAREDFVDFLFSFLTIPLGSVLHLLGGKSDLWCLDNLFKSVKDLNRDWFVSVYGDVNLNRGCFASPFGIGAVGLQERLLYSGIAPEARCSIKAFNIYNEGARTYYFNSNNSDHIMERPLFGWTRLTSEDPRTPPGGFVKKPAMYMVSDKLEVSSLHSYSFSSLKTLEYTTDDLEERSVTIGNKEALYLLKASLVSTTPLTDILTLLAKKPKQEK